MLTYSCRYKEGGLCLREGRVDDQCHPAGMEPGRPQRGQAPAPAAQQHHK